MTTPSNLIAEWPDVDPQLLDKEILGGYRPPFLRGFVNIAPAVALAGASADRTWRLHRVACPRRLARTATTGTSGKRTARPAWSPPDTMVFTGSGRFGVASGDR